VGEAPLTAHGALELAGRRKEGSIHENGEHETNSSESVRNRWESEQWLVAVGHSAKLSRSSSGEGGVLW